MELHNLVPPITMIFRSLILQVRHYCSLEDKVEEWGWEEHDGQSYGKQTIIDAQSNLKMVIYVRIYDGGIVPVIDLPEP